MVTASAPAITRADALEEGFRNPPQPSRPQVWWHWMSGNVTSQGAIMDLEWMQRMGIGGVHAFAGGRLEPTYVENPLPFMSPGWRDAYRNAVKVATGMKMEVTIAGSPGWSQTGGPWVPPQQAMKKYVWSETSITDGQVVRTLPQPPQIAGHFQARPRSQGFGPIRSLPPIYGDSVVFAFPTPADDAPLHASLSSNGRQLGTTDELVADLSGQISLPVPVNGLPSLDLDLGGGNRTIRAISLAASPLPAFTVLASTDSNTFRVIANFPKDNAEIVAPQHSYALPETVASMLRIVFDRPHVAQLLPGRPAPAQPTPPITTIQLHRIAAFAAPRVDQFEAKAGFQAVDTFGPRPPLLTTSRASIDPAQVIDLTDHLSSDGSFSWTPPHGAWTIIRLGWSLTGQLNNPAEDVGTGLEVDKLDAKAVQSYADQLLALYNSNAGIPLGKDGISGLLTDSWEAGPQNWTPALLAEFKRLRGYSPLPWLPVLSGRVVKDAAASDAFLFDFRRTLKDLMLTNHYDVLAQEAHRHGMTYYTEAQGDAPRAISDGLTVKSRADIPTAEYWYRRFSTDEGQPPLLADLEEAASAAHIHGKPLVAAESFTVAAGSDPWAFSPGMLRPVADQIFVHGINRILIHESHMQPYVDHKPGLELGFFGQFFNRNETWAEYARPFVDYLASTSFMLQQGQPVADISVFYGEEQALTQRYEHAFEQAVPKGYGFDYLDPDSLLHHLTVKNGRLVTDGGMSYRVLYLPEYVRHLTPEALARLDDLVKGGAILVGRKPVGPLGLPGNTQDFQMRLDRLWDSEKGIRHAYGQGKVYATSDLAQALAEQGITADLQASPRSELASIHRRAGQRDIYFLANQASSPFKGRLHLRARGQASWWNAQDRSIRPLSYSQTHDGLDVELSLAAQESGFLVVSPSVIANRKVEAPHLIARQAISNGWDVSFEPQRGAPKRASFPQLSDWSQSADKGIRYFSGTATYKRKIYITKSMIRPNRDVWLNLGDVRELAVVLIDGKEIATAWQSPYRVQLTGKVSSGKHNLEVKVANLWVNRLVGDKQPGAQPIAWAPQSPYRADTPLRPSGMLGPVTIELFR